MTAPRRTALMMVFCLSASGLCLVRGGDEDDERPAPPKFDPPDTPVLHSFRDPGGAVWRMGFSGDGRVLYTLTADSKNGVTPDGLHLWDVEAGKPLSRFAPSAGLGQVGIRTGLNTKIALSPDGRIVAVDTTSAPTRNDTYALLLDAESGKLLKKHSFYCGVAWLAFSPDGTALAVGHRSAEGMVTRWDVATGKVAWESTSHVGPSSFNNTDWGAFAPDDKTVAAEFADGSVSVFDAASGKEAVLQPAPPYAGQHHKLVYSPDGRFLATLSLQDEEVRVRNVGSRKVARLIPLNPPPVPCSFHLLRTRRGLVAPRVQGYEMGYSPDGRTLVVWCGDDQIRLFEVASGKLRREIEFKGMEVAFSPAATVAALATSGGAVYLCDWRADGRSRPARLRPGEAERLWDDLASDDGAVAWRAVLALAAAPPQAVKTLGAHLRARQPVSARELERLTAQLDDDVYENREEASRRLAALGDAAGPALQKALANDPPPELRRRVEELTALLDRPPGPEEFRKVRAVEALEYAGSAEARGLLEEWTAGAAGVLLTEEARAALRRMEHKPPYSDP